MAGQPHGGRLVNRLLSAEESREWLGRVQELPAVALGQRELRDLGLLGVGAFSPLDGFMDSADYGGVINHMHLHSGLVWTIPITLPVPAARAADLKEGKTVLLRDAIGRPRGLLELHEIYTYDREREARKVFQTEDVNHPGVRALYEQGDVLLGGPVWLFAPRQDLPLAVPARTPETSRQAFAERGWQSVVGFLAHGPLYRPQEYMHKCAVEMVDGLLLHALADDTGDGTPLPAGMRSYEVLLREYYPHNRVLLGTLAISMRYGGPREAVFHALVHKNFGCTHFILTRDYAIVGNFYGLYDARHIFSEMEGENLGIVPLIFEHSFYCLRCCGMASTKTCPHGDEHHIALSGTRIWALLRGGHIPPTECSRPEVTAVLAEAMLHESADR